MSHIFVLPLPVSRHIRSALPLKSKSASVGTTGGANAVTCADSSLMYSMPFATTGLSQWMLPIALLLQSCVPVSGSSARSELLAA
jgi:hypothetical protein